MTTREVCPGWVLTTWEDSGDWRVPELRSPPAVCVYISVDGQFCATYVVDRVIVIPAAAFRALLAAHAEREARVRQRAATPPKADR